MTSASVFVVGLDRVASPILSHDLRFCVCCGVGQCDLTHFVTGTSDSLFVGRPVQVTSGDRPLQVTSVVRPSQVTSDDRPVQVTSDDRPLQVTSGDRPLQVTSALVQLALQCRCPSSPPSASEGFSRPAGRVLLTAVQCCCPCPPVLPHPVMVSAVLQDMFCSLLSFASGAQGKFFHLCMCLLVFLWLVRRGEMITRSSSR